MENCDTYPVKTNKMTRNTAEEDCFSASLAPICFSIFSEKARERSAALSKLRTILPLSIKDHRQFTSLSAEKVVKSLLDWLHAELRLFQKSPQKDNSVLINSALKELKWSLSLFDSHFPRIKLSGILLEIIDRLTDVLDQVKEASPAPEITFLLNNIILCKEPYLKLLKDSKLSSRFHRLLAALHHHITQPDAPEALIKSCSFMAVAIPESLKLLPFTYELFHEAFLNYFAASSSKIDALLPTVLSSLNIMLLDNFEHNTKFAISYVPFLMPVIRCKTNAVLFQKALQFFLLVSSKLSYEQRTQLSDLLEAELEDPLNCPLYSYDPVAFCIQSIQKDYKSLNDYIRFFFLTLCDRILPFEISKNFPIPFLLFRILNNTSNSDYSALAIPAIHKKYSSDWIHLLKFHAHIDIFLYDNFDNGSKAFNWYKIWYITSNHAFATFTDVSVSKLDNFILKSLKSDDNLFTKNTLLALKSYFKFRFDDLWWTKSAEVAFSLFLDSISEKISEAILKGGHEDVDLLVDFLNCLLAPFDTALSLKQKKCMDLKVQDCELFSDKIMKMSQSYKFIFFDSTTATKSTTNFISFPKSANPFYCDAIVNFLTSISVETCSDDKQPANHLFLDFFKTIFNLLSSNVKSFDYFYLDPSFIEPLIPLSSIIAEKVEITCLLSWLIPTLNASQKTPEMELENSSPDMEIDDEFMSSTAKNSEFDVNLIIPEVFKEIKNDSYKLLVSFANDLLSKYSTSQSSLFTSEHVQILNDWKLFMDEFKNSAAVSQINTPKEVFNTLKDFTPYFNLPMEAIVNIKFDLETVLPNPKTASKNLITPEQWITFLFILFKRKDASLDLIVDWLLSCIRTIDLNSSQILHEFIQTNMTESIFNLLFKKYLLSGIENNTRIQNFPFILLSNQNISPLNWILKCPHFPLVLSQFPSIEALILSFSSNCDMKSVLNSNLTHLMASCLLDEADAKIASRPPRDFSFLKTPLVAQVKFVDLAAAVLAHGQVYPWDALVASLKSLAKMFKLSAAPDFSELFNPVHAICIIKTLLPRIFDFSYLKMLFTKIPILSHHLQLLEITTLLLNSSAKKFHHSFDGFDSFTEFAKEKIGNTLCRADEPQLHDDDVSIFSTILIYCRAKLFSDQISFSICEVLYKILNLTHSSNGPREYPLDSELLPPKIIEDLKMFVLPIGSKVLSFPNRTISSESSTVNFFSNEHASTDYWKDACVASVLADVCSYCFSVSQRCKELTFVVDLIREDVEGSPDFFRSILPSIIKYSMPSFAPRLLFQKLINGLDLCSCPKVCKLIIEIVHLIVDMISIDQNAADTILRMFSSNLKVLKTLQDSTENASEALYYFELSRESSKLSKAELDLEELLSIHQKSSICNDDYVAVIKKRLSTFDLIGSTWPSEETVDKSSITLSENTDICWLNRRWIDEKDFIPIDLKFNSFMFQSSQLNKLQMLLTCSNNQATPTFTLPVLHCLEDVLKNKKSPNLKDLIRIANEVPSKVNFQGIALLALVSPKMDQISRHLLMDMTAKILHKQGNLDLALETAKRALNIFPNTLPDESKALLLSRIGEWAASTKSERPSHIISNYLEKAMALCENTSSFSSESLAQIHIKVARFVDEQYQQIKDSEDFKSRERLLEESRAALTYAKSSLTNTSLTAHERRQLEISISTLRSQYDLDMQEYTERLRSLNSFLLKAVQNYIASLTFGSDSLSESEKMAAVSRLCTIWFINSEYSAINDLINNSIGTAATKRPLPLHLFLPLIYQLAARASFDRSAANPSHFQRTLLRLLVQLTLNFPFDCIYQLLALRAGSGDPSSSTISTKRRKLLNSPIDLDNEATRKSSDADLRAAAASIIIDQSRKVPELNSNIAAIEVMVDAYIELADTAPPESSTKNTQSSRFDFGRELKVSKLLYPLPLDSPLKQIPIPTCSSEEKQLFAGFINGYRLCGGINLPKQIYIFSEDKSPVSQLVKGKDDVRQDAVMEQVFLRVNRLLASDSETRRRALSMRTYRVIPLRPLVGILEWVQNSIPLATYLTEAHGRLNPGDLSPSKCRDLLRAEAERPGSTVQSKMNVLLKEVGQRFKPVLRHFFFEHFAMNKWWTAKQAFISSMATASIVGWIVGLGDRHGMNILLDKHTGQVVHIDLNMIFEAGRTLRIPERVPFRLTPDCVDGLGPEGIALEGPFKNHAIAALKVLRREHSLLLMILDVFKYDPLQKWAGIAKAIDVNKFVANSANISLNNSSSTSTTVSSDLISKEADRTIMRIREKLEGREEGVVLSEAGHVAYLIQSATDPELLCQMYFGWQPYF